MTLGLAFIRWLNERFYEKKIKERQSEVDSNILINTWFELSYPVHEKKRVEKADVHIMPLMFLYVVV